MVDFIKKIQDAIRRVKNKKNPYKKIKSIDDLLVWSNLNKMHILNKYDLSSVDLREQKGIFVGILKNRWQPHNVEPEIVCGWTDNVVWPDADKMPVGFEPRKMLEESKYPTEMSVIHKNGKTGKGVAIAIIDSKLNRNHSEYYVKEYTVIGDNWGKCPYERHGSMVAGCAVGKNTGTAPDADLYYFAANSYKDEKENLDAGQTKHRLTAIDEIIKKNRKLEQNKKIRFISMSSGLFKDYESAAKKCRENGIMLMTCDAQDTSLQSLIIPCDKRYPVDDSEDRIGIPTNGKTTPYHEGGYLYKRSGGNSSTIPYLAGVFACALQDNTIFCTRPNWQDELIEIMKQTVSEHPMGGKIINPTGIVERVSEIARAMEMDLIKQQVSQHE